MTNWWSYGRPGVGIWRSACLVEKPLNDSPVFGPERLESSVGVNRVAFLAFSMTGLGFSLFKSTVRNHLPICFLTSIILLPLPFLLLCLFSWGLKESPYCYFSGASVERESKCVSFAICCCH